MPVSGGRCFRNLVNASRPPAEAPIPTLGKDAGERLLGDADRAWTPQRDLPV